VSISKSATERHVAAADSRSAARAMSALCNSSSIAGIARPFRADVNNMLTGGSRLSSHAGYMAASTPPTRTTAAGTVVALCKLVSRVVLSGWGATLRLAFIVVIATVCLVALVTFGAWPGLSALL